MIAQFRLWFDGRSLREKRLLLAMMALFALTIVWLGIIRPLGDGLASSRHRHTNAVIALAETEARLDTLKALQKNRPAPLTGPLDAIMRQRANEAGFPLGNVTAQGNDRVQISVTSARPGALFSWIADLEDAGILVDQLDITNNGDQTVAAQMTLKARGA